MIAKKLVPALILVAAIAAVLVYQFGMARNGGRADAVAVSGNIEVVDAQVAFKIAGRVETRPVDEGEVVEKGQVVALLDTSDLKHEVDLREAEVQGAQAALAELVAGSRPQEIAASAAAMQKAQAFLDELLHGSRPQEIVVAEAGVRKAMAEKTRLETELGRATQLRQTGTITAEDLDRARSAYDVAAAALREATERLALVKEGPRQEQIEQARAALAQAKAQYELVKIGPRQEDIDQARARLGQSKASLGLARTRLDYATLHAPMNGVVLSKNIEPGEYVSPGTPVITIGDLKNVWLRGYVDARLVGQIKLGQAAEVTTDTPGKVYRGRVGFISQEAEFTPKTVQTEQERVKLVYRLKIDIPNPSGELKPGMPADARIALGGGASQGK